MKVYHYGDNLIHWKRESTSYHIDKPSDADHVKILEENDNGGIDV